MLNKNGKGGGMSSKEFVSFMEGLQSSRNIVADPSRAVSMATYTESNYASVKGQRLKIKQSHIRCPLKARIIFQVCCKKKKQL